VSQGKGQLRYQWSSGPNDTLSSLDIVMGNTTQYIVTVSDSLCSASDSMTFTRNMPTFISAGADISLCISSGTVNLNGTPTGGVWTGTGVSANTFSPLISGPGAFNLVYTFTDSNGCEGVDTALYTVNISPTVNAGNDTAVCADAYLNLDGLPSGGSWSGQGVSGNQFNPAGLSGNKTITYSYTDINGCTNTDTRNVTVNALRYKCLP
jgi:hypothetical protein